MKLLSIDASTKSAAFAFFKDSSLEKWGKIVFEGNDLYERCTDIGKKTRALFAHADLDLVLIEKTIFVNSPAVAQNLASTQGALISALGATQKARILGVGPTEWQNFIGNSTFKKPEKDALKKANPDKSDAWIKGKIRDARKQYTIDWVNNKYNLKLTDNDVCDAIGIGCWGIDKYGK